MRVRSITVSRLALAIAVVAVAVVVGRHGFLPRPDPSRPALLEEPPGKAAAPARPGVGGPAGNPFVDKTPPPDDEGPGAVDFRAYRYTTDQAIRLFEERARRNPNDFVSLAVLGESQALKAREAHDPGGYARAEDALRQSLRLSPGYTRARTSLAWVLCDRHKFTEGLALASQVYNENPGNLVALATLGDAQLGLGRYSAAEETYQRLLIQSSEPAALVRMAHLAELKGQTDEALRLLRQAVDAQRKLGDARGAAWYQVRLGEICFDAGRLDDAEKAYRAVLAELPEDPDATANLGKVLAARGRYEEAIRMLEKAAASAPEPATLAALAQTYRKHGAAGPAQAALDRFEQAVLRYPEYRRELALYYADHDHQLESALKLAQEELAARPDLYSYDVLAWALHKLGRSEEAAQAMAESLRLGTQDARLFYHAGMIEHRLGQRSRARTWLRRALALNPHFSLDDAEDARRTLALLDDGTAPPAEDPPRPP
jgi:tetratricopeptide (TPR) repeat protein